MRRSARGLMSKDKLRELLIGTLGGPLTDAERREAEAPAPAEQEGCEAQADDWIN